MTEQDATTVAEKPSRRWPPWLGVVFVASIAANLFFAGAAATAIWRHHGGGLPMAQPGVFAYTRSLSPDRRRTLLEATRPEREALRPFLAELRRARTDLRATLAATPFDIEAYRRANETLLAADVRVRGLAHRLYESLVSKMTDKERAGLARWLVRTEKPWRSRHRGPPGGPPEEGGADPVPPGGPVPDRKP